MKLIFISRTEGLVFTNIGLQHLMGLMCLWGTRPDLKVLNWANIAPKLLIAPELRIIQKILLYPCIAPITVYEN